MNGMILIILVTIKKMSKSMPALNNKYNLNKSLDKSLPNNLEIICLKNKKVYLKYKIRFRI